MMTACAVPRPHPPDRSRRPRPGRGAAAAHEAGEAGEVLRFWERPRPAVVLGAGCRLADDVHEAACRADGVPVLRRASGGGTVLLGPGCLLYTLVLDSERAPELAGIRSSYAFILGRVAEALHGARPESATWPRPTASSPATPSSASGASCCTTARCSTPSIWGRWARTCRRRRGSRSTGPAATTPPSCATWTCRRRKSSAASALRGPPRLRKRNGRRTRCGSWSRRNTTGRSGRGGARKQA